MALNALLKVLDDLSEQKQRRVQEHLKTKTPSEAVLAVLDTFKPERQTCPDCGSVDKVKHGRRAGRQRLKCKDCGRLYTELTNTPLEGMRKPLETFVQFFKMVKEGKSVQKIGEECDISPTTAFYWRKNVMAFFSDLQEKRVLEGIVEVDETYHFRSKKGRNVSSRNSRERGGSADKRGLSREQDCVLTLQDRSGNTFMKLAGRGKPGLNDIEQPLSHHAQSDAVLCTDGVQAYGAFSRKYGVNRKRVKKTDESSYHLQNVNNLHSRLGQWIENFKGLSTKHLNKYVGFFSAVLA